MAGARRAGTVKKGRAAVATIGKAGSRKKGKAAMAAAGRKKATRSPAEPWGYGMLFGVDRLWSVDPRDWQDRKHDRISLGFVDPINRFMSGGPAEPGLRSVFADGKVLRFHVRGMTEGGGTTWLMVTLRRQRSAGGWRTDAHVTLQAFWDDSFDLLRSGWSGIDPDRLARREERARRLGVNMHKDPNDEAGFGLEVEVVLVDLAGFDDLSGRLEPVTREFERGAAARWLHVLGRDSDEGRGGGEAWRLAGVHAGDATRVARLALIDMVRTLPAMMPGIVPGDLDRPDAFHARVGRPDVAVWGRDSMVREKAWDDEGGMIIRRRKSPVPELLLAIAEAVHEPSSEPWDSRWYPVNVGRDAVREGTHLIWRHDTTPLAREYLYPVFLGIERGLLEGGVASRGRPATLQDWMRMAGTR